MKKYNYLYIFIFAFMILFAKFPSYAEEKDLSVNLTKDAGAAIFYFEFETEQDYDVTITKPNGEVIGQSIVGSSGVVTVLDPRSGVYNILITAEDEISVSARVEINNNSSAALVESGVTISSSITGLQLYFIDGDIAGEWNDTNLGKVNIVVTNPKNMQVLYNTAVEDNSFILKLPDDIQEIEIYIVPSSSAKVNGAGVTYTLSVVKDLNAEVHLPENYLTNREIATIAVDLEDEFIIEIIENGFTVYEEDLPPGEHDIDIPLNAIDNDIFLYVRDKKGNMSTYSCEIHKDIIAPTLKLSDTYDRGNIRDENIMIEGLVTDADFLFVNGEEIEIPANGKFSTPCELEIGDNEIIICAMDVAGNDNTITLNIIRKDTSIALGIIAAPAGIMVLALFFCLRYKRRSMQLAKEERKETKKLKESKKEDLPATISDPLVEKKLKRRKRNFYLAKLANTAIVIAGVYILFNVCFFTTYVASGSMEPTLKTGNIVIYNKLYYKTHSYGRGDIICLWSNSYNNYIAKRIIGLPGDEIEFHDGHLFINGRICREDYISEGVETNGIKKFIVPEGQVFILGDNRENSVDSRYWTEPYVNMDDIVGKYFGTIKRP